MITTLAPVEKSVWVPLSAEKAFKLYTSDLAAWWPVATHSLSASRLNSVPISVSLEPRKGGRIMELCPDGTAAPWATITDWAPGERLGLSWYVGRPEAEATKVMVTFASDGDGTLVSVRHDGFEVLGKSAQNIRDGYDSGWVLVLLECYGKAAKA